MQNKRSLFLNQVANARFDRSKDESNSNSKVAYVVTKTINTTAYTIGEELSKNIVSQLCDGGIYTITIVKEKKR
jgi:hypothetical protein